MEQSYKEKYEDILARLERAKNDNEVCDERFCCVINDLIPELAESEDEKIRKTLIQLFQSDNEESFGDFTNKQFVAWLEKQGHEPKWCHHKVDLSNCSEEYRKAYYDGWNNCNMQHSQCESEKSDVLKCLINGMKFYYEDNEEATWGTQKFPMKVKDILSWLERQGGKKPADKVEPKFKVGDWLIFNESHNSVYQVERIDNYRYYLRHYLGGTMSVHFDNELIRLWTIQDAKDGDVLCCESGWTCIFKALNSDNISFSSYCFMDSDKWFCNTGCECHTLDKAFVKAYNAEIYPATKEQRDTLLKAMADVGYTFDFENKKLKKIEHKPEENKGNIGGISADWSEEDEVGLGDALWAIKQARTIAKDENDMGNLWYAENWLKSLKPQPKQSFDEDTQQWIDTIIKDYEDLYNTDKDHRATIQAKISILKSLRPQNHWKPSDEQMTALRFIKKAKILDPEERESLNSLYIHLKKLKEE